MQREQQRQPAFATDEHRPEDYDSDEEAAAREEAEAFAREWPRERHPVRRALPVIHNPDLSSTLGQLERSAKPRNHFRLVVQPCSRTVGLQMRCNSSTWLPVVQGTVCEERNCHCNPN